MSSKLSQEQNLAETYQQKTDIEHILDAPDTYIGPVDSDNIKNWILNSENEIVNQHYDFIGGLYKLFDEGIVNCRDHVVRLQQKKKIKKKISNL